MSTLGIELNVSSSTSLRTYFLFDESSIGGKYSASSTEGFPVMVRVLSALSNVKIGIEGKIPPTLEGIGKIRGAVTCRLTPAFFTAIRALSTAA